jgi:aspartate ammonia-lyase
VLWGIHTLRATENFPVVGRSPDKQLIHSYGLIKLACIRTARSSDLWTLPADCIDALETPAANSPTEFLTTVSLLMHSAAAPVPVST